MKRKNLFVLAASVLLLVACGGTPASSPTSSSTEHQTGLTTDPTPTSESTPAPTSESTPEPSSETTPAPTSESSETPEESSSEPAVEYSVSITNKDELTAAWYCVDGNRTLSFNFSPAGNRMELFESGLLKVESSNPDVVLAQNALLTPKAKGKAKITITYGDASDSVDVEVLGIYDESKVTAIEDIKLEKGADGKYIDATFTTAGVVTAPFKGGFFLDNGKGAIEVYVTGLDVAQGDYIIGGGTVTAYNTILEFKDFKVGTKLDKSLAPKTTLENPVEVGKTWGETETTFDGFKAISVWGTITTFTSNGTDYDAIYPEDEGTYPVEPSYYQGTLTKGDKVHWVGYGWNRTKYGYLGIYIDRFVEHEVESFTIEAKEDLYKGGTAKMGLATYLPKIATEIKNENFNWTVEPTTLATIDDNGVLTGLAEGEVTVRAASKANSTVAAEVKVQVQDRGGAVAAVNLSATELALKVGEESTLTAEVVSADPANPSKLNEIAWSSEDESVLTVDENGKITTLKNGTTNVVATTLNVGADGKPIVAKCAVTVSYASIKDFAKGLKVDINVKVMQIGYNSFTVDDGTAGTNVYNAYDKEAKKNKFDFPEVGAVVNVKGEVTAYNGGLQITPTAIAAVDAVVEPTQATALTAELIEEYYAAAANGLVPHGLVKLTAIKCSETGNKPKFEAPGRVLQGVNYDAKKVPLEAQKFYDVTGYVYGKDGDNLTMNIVSAEESKIPTLEVAIDKATIKVGETAQITATATNFDVAPTITYESGDTSIATVSDAGVVTGVAAGNVEITVKAGDLQQKVSVQVIAADVSSVTVNFDLRTYAAEKGITSQTKVTSIDLDNVVTATAAGSDANTGKVYVGDSKTEWRFYKSGSATLTISAKEGYELVSVSVGLAKSNYGDPTDTPVEIKDGKAVVSSVALNSNFNVNAIKVTYKIAGEEEEEGNPLLPVVAEGNAGRQTHVEGADAWIYLDNKDLGITGANADAVIAASSVDLLVSYDGDNEAAKPYVTGGSAAVVMKNGFSFNDYDDANHTVRLLINMDKGLDSSWGVKHAFTIRLVVGDKTYEGVVNFEGNALVNVTPIPEALPDPIESTWNAAITDASADLDGGKFKKSSTYRFNFTAAKAGKVQLYMTIKCSAGHEGATFGQENYNNSGKVMTFAVANNGNAGKFLGEGKTYTQFGLTTSSKLLAFAEFEVVEGNNEVTITTDDGGFRLTPKVEGAMNLVYVA